METIWHVVWRSGDGKQPVCWACDSDMTEDSAEYITREGPHRTIIRRCCSACVEDRGDGWRKIAKDEVVAYEVMTS